MAKKKITAVTVVNPMKAELSQVTEMSLTKEDVIDLMVEQMKQEATAQYAELKKQAGTVEARRKDIAIELATADKKVQAAIALFSECLSPLVVRKDDNTSYVNINFDYDYGHNGDQHRLKNISIVVVIASKYDRDCGDSRTRVNFRLPIAKGDKYYAELEESFYLQGKLEKLGSKIQNFERNEKSVRRELKQKMLQDILNGTSEGKNLMEFVKTKVQSEFGKVIAGVQG